MKITLDDLHVLYTEEQLKTRIKDLAEELNEYYKDEKDIYLVCVLKGSVMFFTELVQHLTIPLRMEFIRLSSYGSDYTSSGTVKAVNLSLPDINGENVLIIEDIIDTGHTAKFLLDYLAHNFKTKSTKFCALLDKKSKRTEPVNADFSGFVVEDKFLVGYGLDFDGFYRNVPYIGYVDV